MQIGSDQEQTDKIHENIEKALDFGKAKRNAENAGRTNIAANLSNVGDLLKFLLNTVSGITQGQFIQLGSLLNGLIDNLSNGIQDDDLVKGLVGGVKRAFDDYSDGIDEGYLNYVKGFLEN